MLSSLKNDLLYTEYNNSTAFGYVELGYEYSSDKVYVYEDRTLNEFKNMITDKQIKDITALLRSKGIELFKNGNDIEIHSEKRIKVISGASTIVLIVDNEVIMLTPEKCKYMVTKHIFPNILDYVVSDKNNVLDWYVMINKKILTYDEIIDNPKLKKVYRKQIRKIKYFIELMYELEEDMYDINISSNDVKIVMKKLEKENVSEELVEEVRNVINYTRQVCGSDVYLDIHYGNIGIDEESGKIVIFDPIYRKVSKYREMYNKGMI